MPEISRFFGIIIQMYFADHAPPHFHATYQEHKIVIDIENGAVIKGKFPPRVLGFVQEWRALHVDELLRNWHQGNIEGKFNKIAPLE